MTVTPKAKHAKIQIQIVFRSFPTVGSVVELIYGCWYYDFAGSPGAACKRAFDKQAPRNGCPASAQRQFPARACTAVCGGTRLPTSCSRPGRSVSTVSQDFLKKDRGGKGSPKAADTLCKVWVPAYFLDR